MRNYPLRLSILYFLLASCWIFFSDYFVELLVPATYITTVQTVKGFGFIVATAFGLFFMVKHYYRLIQRSELEYRKLFKDNPHPMWVYDSDTLRFLTVNDAAINKYHYTSEEFRSLKITDIRPKQDEDSILMFVRGLEQKTFHDSGIWRHRDKNGRLFFVKITSHSTSFANAKARVVLAMDVDEQIQAQQKIQLSEMKLKALINNTDDLIWMVDSDRKIIAANGAFIIRMKNRFNIEINPDKKFDLNELKEQGFLANWSNYIQQALQGENLRIEEEVELVSGKEYYDIIINPIYDDNKQLVGAGCFARDITQRKQSEDRIKNQVQKLREVAWIQSHEVRKPLANILGLLDLLKQQPAVSDTHQELIAHMEASCKEFDCIVKKIVEKSSPSDTSSGLQA